MIGNFAFETEFGPVVGFENHSGRTPGPGAKPLGRVLRGFGNNGEDGLKALDIKTCSGPQPRPRPAKNPEFCDGILKTALLRRWGSAELRPTARLLSEREAHDSVLAKILGQS